MTGARRSIAVVLCAAQLAACATAGPPSPDADSEAQIDGKKMEAKPGMGRVYLVHGDTFPPSRTPTARSGATPIHGSLIGAVIGGLIVGMVEGAMDVHERKKAAEAKLDTEIKETGIYYLDDHELGVMGPKQFMALDLPPGTYVIGYQKSKDGRAKMKQTFDLKAGDVRPFWSRVNQTGLLEEDKWTGMYPCPDDCSDRILAGVRITANLPSVVAATAGSPNQTKPSE